MQDTADNYEYRALQEDDRQRAWPRGDHGMQTHVDLGQQQGREEEEPFPPSPAGRTAHRPQRAHEGDDGGLENATLAELEQMLHQTMQQFNLTLGNSTAPASAGPSAAMTAGPGPGVGAGGAHSMRVPSNKDMALGMGDREGPFDISDIWAVESQPSASQPSISHSEQDQGRGGLGGHGGGASQPMVFSQHMDGAWRFGIGLGHVLLVPFIVLLQRVSCLTLTLVTPFALQTMGRRSTPMRGPTDGIRSTSKHPTTTMKSRSRRTSTTTSSSSRSGRTPCRTTTHGRAATKRPPRGPRRSPTSREHTHTTTSSTSTSPSPNASTLQPRTVPCRPSSAAPHRSSSALPPG